MRIAYVTNARIPNERAHGLQIMQMCASFARAGHEVTLIVPDRKNTLGADAWDYYRLKPSFRIARVPVVDLIRFDRWLGHWPFRLMAFFFALRSRRVIEEMKPDVIYSRDPFSSILMPSWIPLVFEAHTLPKSQHWFHRLLWKKAWRVVALTAELKRRICALGVPEGKVLVAHDAVDPERFAVSGTRAETRKALKLPEDAFLAVYAGHLYPYTGVSEMLAAAASFPPGAKLVLVGGRDKELEDVRAEAARLGAKNVEIGGHVPHDLVPKYLHAADALLMSYRDDGRHVTHFASPLKLFEYLAAGRAIVTTDLPSLREVLDDRTALFVPPGDPKALSAAVTKLAGDAAERSRLEASALERSKAHTWAARAEAVVSGVPAKPSEAGYSFWRRYRLEFAVAGFAFLLRFIYVAFFPQHPVLGGDGDLYLAIADNLRGVRDAQGVPAYYQPFYPLMLTAIRAVFGEAIVWIRIVQALLSAATVFVSMLIARRWISAYAGWIAGLVMALYMPMILESGILYTETTYTFLLTLSAYLFLEATDRKGWKPAMLAGAALALAALTREIILYFVPVMAAWLAWTRRSWKPAVLLLIPILMAFGAMSVRNRIVAESAAPDVQVPAIAKNYDKVIFESKFRELAFSPSRWPLYAEGAWRFFRFPFRLLDVSSDVSLKQALLDRDWKALREGWDGFAVKGFLVAFEWFLVAMAAVGAVRGQADKRFKAVALGLIFYAMATILLRTVGHVRGFDAFEPLARYRFPTEPLIILLAAAGIERLSRGKLVRYETPRTPKP